ncbi:MAG: hypothetical protein ACYCYE_01025 [Clostridia bacterium]
MGSVKMPEMLSPELIEALAGNVYNVKDVPSPKDEMAAAWNKKYTPGKCWRDDECCCPKKVKFIFLLNNAVVIYVNAVCEEDRCLA